MTKTLKWMGAAGASLFAALPAFAQEAAEKATEAAAGAATAVAAASDLLAGKVRGRIIVDVNR